MRSSDLSSAIEVALRYWRNGCYRRLLPALGLLNRRVDRLALPIPDHMLSQLVPVQELAVSSQEVKAFISQTGLLKYESLPYLHSKALEYYLTFRIWSPLMGEGARVLDAAGGGRAEYIRACKRVMPTMQSLSQDALLAGAKGHDVEFIGGGVDSIECESNSVDVVTCHHSVEHFQGAVDTAFVAESLRVLKPGGLLIVAPLFVAQHHGEYANTRSIADSTGGILDRTAAFAGWGPYEGFARVYSPETLERRLIAPATGLNASVSIIRLVVDGADVPDLVANRHQVKINRPLRALVIQKSR